MPMYEYRCNACKREFEYEQRMSDDDLVTCEACGEDKLEKLISRTAFTLKGGGWYKDLYASPKDSSTKSETKADSSTSASDSSSSSSSASESKPAAAPTPAAASSTGSGSKE